MRQSIRALGWAITLSMVILFAFLGTAIYSMVQMILEGEGIKLGEVRGEISNTTLTLYIPLIINNTSHYDITSFNITLILKDSNGTIITDQSTLIDIIKRNSARRAVNNLTLNVIDLISNMQYLLYQDSEFKIELSLSFKYAYTLSFKVETSNISMPWGAPLYGFSITRFSDPYNVSLTGCYIDVYLSFENHAYFGIIGIVNMKMYNDRDEIIGYGKKEIDVSPRQIFSDYVTIHVSNLTGYTGSGYVEITFESPVLGSINLGRVSYG
ncbi:hypothetical protein CW702_02360 [Candidatus Bathyarchaeota archaeon]|nr:MAG: hypothetical protein CW702_02360 [Candidatus Bathyarchaeota archaeon]